MEPVEDKEKDVSGKDDFELREHIRKLTEPIFDRFLKEVTPNRISVGGGRSDSGEVNFYCPHNLRLYFDFDKATFDSQPRVETDLLRSVVTTERNYGSEKCFKNFLGCEIVVKKRTIEVRDYRSHKKWYSIVQKNAREEHVNIWVQIISEALPVLKEFIRCYGGSSSFTLLNVWSENAIIGEKAINQIPLKQDFFNAVGKKLYKEHKFEFNSPALSSTYLEKRSQEEFIVKELSDVRAEIGEVLQATTSSFNSSVEKLSGVLVPLTEQVSWLDKNLRTHEAVLSGIGKGLEAQAESQKLQTRVQEETLGALEGIKVALKSRKGRKRQRKRVNEASGMGWREERLVKAKKLLKEWGW